MPQQRRGGIPLLPGMVGGATRRNLLVGLLYLLALLLSGSLALGAL